LARLRSWLLLALAIGVIAVWGTAVESGRVFDTWAYLKDTAVNSSNTVTTDTLGPPSNLSATSSVPQQIALSWTATDDAYATHYQVFRCSPGPCTPSAQIGASPVAEGSLGCNVAPTPLCSYTDTGLTGGTNYCYKVVTAYLISSVVVWTSASSNTACATAQLPVTLNDLLLKSVAQNTNTECSSAANSLVQSGATGGCKISATTHEPFNHAEWCGTAKVTANQDWSLTLDIDRSNPFQSATLTAVLKLNDTTIASSGVINVPKTPTTPVQATLTAVANAVTPGTTGTLCLTITNNTVDSNPNSGTAHDARIITTGNSKLHGPFDFVP
jgi:hypothetical protein